MPARPAIDGMAASLATSGTNKGDIVYEARLINSGDGTYKGYPLSGHEWPLHLLE